MKTHKTHQYHGMSNLPEYQVWADMKARCGNPKHRQYKNYGARGIAVCAQWTEFATFIKDMGLRPTASHSIERLENDKNYCKENCIWATQKQQNRNTRQNHHLTFNGKTLSIAEWVEITGINRATLCHRLSLRWSVEKTLTTPVLHNKRYVTVNGLTLTVSEWATRLGLLKHLVFYRIWQGMPAEEALGLKE
jgi:hypothetical protein